jgi:signal transduction histidine kinase
MHVLSPAVRFIILLVAFLTLLPTAFATGEIDLPTLDIKEDGKRLYLENAAVYLRDTTGKLTVADVAAESREPQWKPLARDATNFDWTDDILWVRGRIHNATDRTDTWYLVFQFARIDLVEAYFGERPTAVTYRTGRIVPFREWPVDHNELTIPVTLKAGEATTLHLKIQNASTMQVGATLLSADEFADQQNFYRQIFATFTAAVLVMLLFGVAVVAAFRERIYMLFVAQILLLSLATFASVNFDLQHLFPWTTLITSSRQSIYGGLSIVVIAAFVRTFFKDELTAKWQRAALDVSTWLPLAAILLVASLQVSLGDKVSALVGTLTLNLLLAVIVSIVFRNRKGALFATGLVLYFLLLGVYIPVKSGILHTEFDVTLFPFLASFSQNLFICLVIFQHIFDLNRALGRQNEELSEMNTILQGEIELRTRLANELELQRRAIEETERLRVMGEMARNIAHEVNTPIAIVSFKLQNLRSLLAKQFKDDSEPMTVCSTSLKILERAASIIKTMRLLARDGKRDVVAEVSVTATISQLLMICSERASTAQIRIEWAPPQPDILVETRESSLFQILTNLVNNAIDSLKNSNTGNRLIVLAVEIRGNTLAFMVSDNGSGVAPENSQKIFDAFFTTKPGATGMGMGLSLARSLAMELGGDLVLESRANPTRFTYSIPLRQNKVTTPTP